MKNMIMKCFMALSVCGAMIACNTDLEEDIEKEKIVVEDPTEKGPLEFDVSLAENSVLKVGETVRFELTGNSDIVNFYSGSFGNAYDYRDQDRFYDIAANLSFKTGKSPDNNTAANWDCARLKYSTDFNGDRSGPDAYTNALAATWIDITDRFAIRGQPGDIADYENSGVQDISDIFSGGGPVYLAWHCTTMAESRRVVFRAIETSLQGVVIDNSTLSAELYNQNGFDFQWALNPAAADQIGYMTTVPRVTSTLVEWSGVFSNVSTASNHPLIGQFKEGYAITKALELPQFNAGKDKPTTLLPKTDGTWATHEYIYNKAGTYEVVFLASHLGGSSSQIIKKITITIEE